MTAHSGPAGPPAACPYELWDGAYVLGSLSPSQRREFEAHLDGCETCSLAVRDLAGLPGLLGRIGPEVLEQPDAEPVPETLLPRLSRAVRRQQRRRTWLTAGVAAAAAVAVTTGGALLVDRPGSAPTAGQGRPPGVVLASSTPMTRVSADPMTASLALTSVAWGTRLDLTCSYPSPQGGRSYGSSAYALVVHTVDGRTQRVATWHGLAGGSMQVSGATAASRRDIASVEVTTLSGTPVARLTL